MPESNAKRLSMFWDADGNNADKKRKIRVNPLHPRPIDKSAYVRIHFCQMASALILSAQPDKIASV